MAPLTPFPVVLTKVSDTTVKFPFLLTEGRDGAPGVRLGSTEEEAARAGEKGVIRIESFHGGPGQYVGPDPTRYEAADSALTSREGVIRLRGEIVKSNDVATNAVFRPWQRGGLVVGAFSAATFQITPTQVYKAGAPVPSVPPAGTEFTGSWAAFGDRVYLGTYDVGTPKTSGFAVALIGGGATTWKASLVASRSDKLWRVDRRADGSADVSWTDAFSGAPNFLFTAAFNARSGNARDLGLVGGHALVAMGGITLQLTSVMTVDINGLFTGLVNDLSSVVAATDFLGGRLYLLGGGASALWLPDVSTYRTLTWDAVSPRWADAEAPRFDYAGVSPTKPVDAAGAAIVADGSTIYFTLYGTFQKILSSGTVKGSAIFTSRLTESGFRTEILATPETTSELENAYVMALAVLSEYASADPPNPRKLLQVLVATPNGANNSDVDLLTIQLWEEASPPKAFDSKTKWLRTSRLSGTHWHTKKALRIRGVARSNSGAATGNIRLYLDGSETAAESFVITANGTPFSLSIAAAHFGRQFAIQFESAAAEEVEWHQPLEIDYFAVPEQQDIVRLQILAGLDQLDRAGGLTREGRATALANIQTMITSGERWILNWWDGTPDWTVVPLSYSAIDVEGAKEAGDGAVAVEIVFQRVA